MKGNILIACYSYSGKTRKIAEVIQEQTGGRLSQIYPRQPYPADFERLLNQVREESRSGKFLHCFLSPKVLTNMTSFLPVRLTGAGPLHLLWRHG